LTEGNFSPGQGWRWLIALSAAPGFLIFICRLFIPESPRYMLINGRYEEAKQLLVDIAHFNGKRAPRGNLVAPHHDHKLSLGEQLRGIFSTGYLRLTLLLWVMWFLLSYGGWGYSYLSPIAFDKLGTNPFLASLSGYAVGLVGNILIMLFLDRVPRIPLLVIGFLISGIITAVVGVNSNPYYVIIMVTIVSFTSTVP
jgi:putative MFS transporter